MARLSEVNNMLMQQAQCVAEDLDRILFELDSEYAVLTKQPKCGYAGKNIFSDLDSILTYIDRRKERILDVQERIRKVKVSSADVESFHEKIKQVYTDIGLDMPALSKYGYVPCATKEK